MDSSSRRYWRSSSKAPSRSVSSGDLFAVEAAANATIVAAASIAQAHAAALRLQLTEGSRPPPPPTGAMRAGDALGGVDCDCTWWPGEAKEGCAGSPACVATGCGQARGASQQAFTSPPSPPGVPGAPMLPSLAGARCGEAGVGCSASTSRTVRRQLLLSSPALRAQLGAGPRPLRALGSPSCSESESEEEEDAHLGAYDVRREAVPSSSSAPPLSPPALPAAPPPLPSAPQTAWAWPPSARKPPRPQRTPTSVLDQTGRSAGSLLAAPSSCGSAASTPGTLHEVDILGECSSFEEEKENGSGRRQSFQRAAAHDGYGLWGAAVVTPPHRSAAAGAQRGCGVLTALGLRGGRVESAGAPPHFAFLKHPPAPVRRGRLCSILG